MLDLYRAASEFRARTAPAEQEETAGATARTRILWGKETKFPKSLRHVD
jgi:hypothetical protein